MTTEAWTTVPANERYDSAAARRSAQARPRQVEQRANVSSDLARTLGWLSVAIGIAEIAAPRTLGRLVGLDGERYRVNRLGLRELAGGLSTLYSRAAGSHASGWLGRTPANLKPLATRLRSGSKPERRLAAALTAVAAVAALDSYRRRRTARDARTWTPMTGVEVKKSITINRSREMLYTFWRTFENLPRFMMHLESVKAVSERTSHWKAKAPAGMSVEWDAEITEDQPNELIAWRSLPNADIDHFGSVRFEEGPGGRGTVVRVELTYRPPGGTAGAMLAKLFGEEPEQQIDADLRRFKQHMETGEIATTEGQPSARGPSKAQRGSREESR